MFNWMRTPVAESTAITPENYSFEGDGHLLAFQEAFEELAEVDEAMAMVNAKGVDAYAEAWEKGGQAAAMEAATSFANGAVMEGFLGDAKDKLVSLLKKLKEKLKAFFHSARQYFDKFFKNAQEFAEKYEDEINDKMSDLSDFKYEMFDYSALGKDSISKKWKAVQDIAEKAADKELLKEAFGIDFTSPVAWVAALEATWVNDSKKIFVNAPDGKRPQDSGWRPMAVADGDSNRDAVTNLVNAGFRAAQHVPMKDDNGGSGSSSSSSSSSGGSDEKTTPSITSQQRKEIQQKVMKALVSDSSATSIDGFKKALHKKYRGGSNKKNVKPDFGEIFKVLKNSNEELDNIKEIESDMTSDFDDMIDIVNDTEGKSANEKTIAKNKVAIFTEGKNVFMAMYNCYKDAVIERNGAYKGCISAALHYSPSKKD